MKKLGILFSVFLFIGLFAAPASAVILELWDYEFYLDGTTYGYGEAAAIPGLDDSAFDWSTGLGVLALTFNPGEGNDYAVDAWFDHDVYNDDFDGSYDDERAAVSGTADAAYGQFGVAYPEGGSTGNAAMWIGYDDIDLAAGEYAVIEFIIGETAVSDFYVTLIQDAYANDSGFEQDAAQLFLSSSIDIRSGVAPVPEPTTMLLLSTGLLGLAGLGKKKGFLKK